MQKPLRSVKFTQDYRTFKKDEVISFKEQITILVGDQGCGKSSLLNLIKNNNTEVLTWDCDRTNSAFFDLEMDNLRTQELSKVNSKFKFQISGMFKSHGECNNTILGYINQVNNILLLLDEPDSALSIKSCYKLVDSMKKAIENNIQIVISAHNPIIIESFPEVLSLEHKCWMSSEDFIKTQKDY